MMNALWELTYVSRHARTPLAATHVTATLAMSWVEMAAHAMVKSKRTKYNNNNYLCYCMYPHF